jgi:hypothetical protein
MCLGKHALGMVNSYNTLFTVIWKIGCIHLSL